jgi:hypothetical protein
MPQRTTIFVSYSRQDSRWLKRLQIHLKPLLRGGALSLWDDTKIAPGDQWRSEIQAAIDRAAASVLLLSADFLASDFVETEELPRILRKASKDGAKILLLFVGPVKLSRYPELDRYQALNSPEEPLSRLPRARADQVLAEVAERLGNLLPPPPPPPPDDGGAELQYATVCLSILTALAAPELKRADQNLTELRKSLEITSRRLAHDAVEQLATAGWLEKRRTEDRTSYRISDEGIGQLKRLAEVAKGPIRQAVADLQLNAR